MTMHLTLLEKKVLKSLTLCSLGNVN